MLLIFGTCFWTCLVNFSDTCTWMLLIPGPVLDITVQFWDKSDCMLFVLRYHVDVFFLY